LAFWNNPDAGSEKRVDMKKIYFRLAPLQADREAACRNPGRRRRPSNGHIIITTSTETVAGVYGLWNHS
jgi:hypothetical protein